MFFTRSWVCSTEYLITLRPFRHSMGNRGRFIAKFVRTRTRIKKNMIQFMFDKTKQKTERKNLKEEWK